MAVILIVETVTAFNFSELATWNTYNNTGHNRLFDTREYKNQY